MFIKKLFRHKKQLPKKSNTVDNSISFSDYNGIKVLINIRTSENIPYIFIGNNKNSFEFAFDKDSAALLATLLNAYAYEGNFSKIETILKEENNEK